MYRELPVPIEGFAGYRLDRFLARWFRERTRSDLARGIRRGEVTLESGQVLRASYRIRGGEVLHIYIPGIAPSGPPPPFPELLHEDERIAVVSKPPGLLAHPTGSNYVYALIGLAKSRWPDHRVELVHRLDKDTSGCLAISKDAEAGRFLKEAVREGGLKKEYQALVRGQIPWDHKVLEGPIGDDTGIIRIKRAVRPDGKHARTDVTVLERSERLTRVHCRIHTGRTHQIRVHLYDAGFPLLGDRLYGVDPEVFLHARYHGIDERVLAAVGAPRHALHAWRLTLPHPDGGSLTIEAPFPEDLQQAWQHPPQWDPALSVPAPVL